MAEPEWDKLALREVLAFAPPGGTFEKGDYPWLEAVRIYLKGGDAGRSDGAPGEDGWMIVELYGPKLP